MTQAEPFLRQPYCCHPWTAWRLPTREVCIGDVPLGAQHPIRIQSMTTTDTMDIQATVQQTLRMVQAGCDYVRITAPSIKHAESLAQIKAELRKKHVHVPLIADIHFTPNAALMAARLVEKVRINPGNYADKKKFQVLEYSDREYDDELQRIRQRFKPLVQICREYGTAMRIGTNHGSLSDRIMSRYGDTPQGMLESAWEFVRICQDEGYHQLVLSMKSSNTQVMVQAYRLLVQRMLQQQCLYPLHLGVTEAGEGEDGRLKSAVGIGTLLADGLGDTVRVSLTEEPEREAPVARSIVQHYAPHWADLYSAKDDPKLSWQQLYQVYNPLQHSRRNTAKRAGLGATQVPWVIADLHSDLTTLRQTQVDAVATQDVWQISETKDHSEFWPIRTLQVDVLQELDSLSSPQVLCLNSEQCTQELMQQLAATSQSFVLVLTSTTEQPTLDLRRTIVRLALAAVPHPIVIDVRHRQFPVETIQDLGSDAAWQIGLACHLGPLLIDGLIDGVWVSGRLLHVRSALGLLQAARLRTVKTEYISCPSCGRTLFDLQETTAQVRQQTDHLKDLKIAVMGCIVNGPGEMADADYGYVGSGPDRITLYRGREVVRKNIPSSEAVRQLIQLIQEDGRWQEPQATTVF